MTFLKVAKEVTKYMGYSCYKICHLDIRKIAQSGHTVRSAGAENFILVFIFMFEKVDHATPSERANELSCSDNYCAGVNHIKRLNDCSKVSRPNILSF